MSTALTLGLNAQLAVLGHDTEAYAQAVQAIPILSAEEEQDLTCALPS
jgi:hypothetical protein